MKRLRPWLLGPCLLLAWHGSAGADACGRPATPIHAVQGRAVESPMTGKRLTVEAVVIASFPGKTGLNGFFVQEEDHDADDDPATSEGLFVYDPSGRDVRPGMLVRLRGTVGEFRGLTQLSRIREFRRCGTARPPAATRVTIDGKALERVEGMLIEVVQPLVVIDTGKLGRRHQLLLTREARQFQPTQRRPPGKSAAALAASDRRQRLVLDDGSMRRDPKLIAYPPPQLTGSTPIRAGGRLDGLRGVIDQFDDDYRLQPVTPPRVEFANDRPDAPPKAAAGELRIAAFNLQNYFNGDGRGGGFPTARGAASRTALARQQRKLVAAIQGMNADIIGVSEAENDGYGPNSAIAELARALSAAGDRYQFIDPGRQRLGNDAITVGLLYRADRVRPAGRSAALDGASDRRFSRANRPSLAQTFEHRATGERLTVVANHFKSKGSSCAARGDRDRSDGQGNCAATRTRAALALIDWLRTDPTGSGDTDILIIGDLNAYALEDPLRALTDAGYTDLIRRHVGANAYTYIFDGWAGYLDHALASASLARQVTNVRIWHINADEPAAFGYDSPQASRLYRADPYRSSDHDPVIVDLRLGAPR